MSSQNMFSKKLQKKVLTLTHSNMFEIKKNCKDNIDNIYLAHISKTVIVKI